MRYLVCCDHRKVTVEATDSVQARMQIGCDKCAQYRLKKNAWSFKDVRVYDANDVRKVDAKVLPRSRVKTNVASQTDWVNETIKEAS